ncbi:hypothetical protein Pcinc_005746 [Petrolisthes cinctipes]|uniref:Nudix hydrolase domain-containing protein n=1 Tax=Petrolisthes cinctipes TaxID=88211 RepID=A0AAE1KYN8_PETCI|nr:hypothetical protein Pcinc_005746 [Petrolisthes cinctipes]
MTFIRRGPHSSVFTLHLFTLYSKDTLMLKVALRSTVVTRCYVSCLNRMKFCPLSQTRHQTTTRMTTNEQNVKECQVESVEEVAKGHWLSLNNYHWTDHRGRKRVWEVVERRKTEGSVRQDSVAMLTLVRQTGQEPALVLIKQFRPPLKTYTIEMPAGLVGPGESVVEAALREVKEETGLTGTITDVGSSDDRVVALDPGISGSTMSIVKVQVDGDQKENQKRDCMHGVEGEHIQVMLVPLSHLHHQLTDFASQGLIVDSRVEALALGLALSHL